MDNSDQLNVVRDLGEVVIAHLTTQYVPTSSCIPHTDVCLWRTLYRGGAITNSAQAGRTGQDQHTPLVTGQSSTGPSIVSQGIH